MANRLLGRFAHLVWRSSSQAPAAAAVRLPLPVAGPAAVSRPKGWPQITARLMCKKTAPDVVLNPDVVTPTQLEDLLEKAEAPGDVLFLWAKHGVYANQAAFALIKWVHLMKTSGELTMYDPELQSDSRINAMMRTVCENLPSVGNSNLVAVFIALCILKLPSSHTVLTSVHKEVMCRMDRLPYKHLSKLVHWGATRKDTVLLNRVFKQLELRWTEIADVKTLMRLMSKPEYLSPSFMDRLEDKALELVEGFSAENIRKICLVLAAQHRRSAALLRAMSYQLLQKPSVEFTTPLIMDLALAFGKLNFYIAEVLQQLSSELLLRVPQLRPVDVRSYAKSLGLLKWLHRPLFEEFAGHYTANSETYTVFELCQLLISFARLAFQPNKERFYSKVHDVLEESLADLEPCLRTDVAWSLCVLQQAKPHYLTPLCQESHLTKLSEGFPNLVENYKRKLLHIAATLHLEHSGSSPSLLPVSVSSSSPSELQSSLRETLLSLVGGKTEVLRTGVDTIYGWTIDGEMVVDRDHKPIDMSALKAPHLPSGGGDQNLPEGTRRLAFLGLEFDDIGTKHRELLGHCVMRKRHLQLAGFITVEVPYYDWMELTTDWMKLAYLEDKMRNSLAEDMAK